MAGIRSFNTNLPHVFRYPEWTEGIFYPSGSVVAVEIIDSDVYYDFYAAIRDVQDLNTWPPSNQGEWRLLHDAFQIDSDTLAALSNFDSELLKIYEALDSERLATQSADSDILLDLDSEIHSRKSADSDILVWAEYKFDSEEIARRSGDSDLQRQIWDNDSDIRVLYARTDSDLIQRLFNELDSEILARFSADSDMMLLLQQAVHNYLANDSEFDSDIRVLRARMDSDFDAAVRVWNLTGIEEPWGPQPFVSNTDFYINNAFITNHTQGYLWLVDHDDVGGTRTPTIYIIKDGVTIGSAPGGLLTTSINGGTTGDWVRGTQITDGAGGADVDVYRNLGDALPEVTNANLWTVMMRAKERAESQTAPDLDTAFRRTVMTVVDMDSDLHELMRKDSENDSDHLQFRHDLLALDSDIKVLQADRDSDNKAIQQLQMNIDSERHDWKAADSELRKWILEGFDSDILNLYDHDSDRAVAIDSEEIARKNADSDIYNGYHGIQFRYVLTEYEPAGFTLNPITINFDNAGNVLNIFGVTGPIWVWNTHNNRLIITDSDTNVIHNEVHLGEPYVISVGQVQYRRAQDTLANADIEVNGAFQVQDDVWGVLVDYIDVFPNGGELTTILDSDINLHDRDSDYTTAMVWLGYKLRDVDSDMKMEVHDRKAADSDLYWLFYVPNETITLQTGVTDYVLTEQYLNERTTWSFKTEIQADAQIYNGVVNDHFEIEHNGTAWVISVDGVDPVKTADIFVSGNPTVSGAAINIPFDVNSTVTINPATGNSPANIALQLYQALLKKSVRATHTTGTPIVSIVTEFSDPNTGIFTSNGVTFNYFNNIVPDSDWYYHDGDTISIRLK